VVWLGPAELLLADGGVRRQRWFPGLLFKATAQGGTAASSLGRSLLVGGLLALAADADAAVVASATFVRVST